MSNMSFPAEQSTANGVGAGIGALAGQVIGGDTGATLIGAGAGALIGNSMSDDD